MSLLWSIVPTADVFATDTPNNYLVRQLPSAEGSLVLSDAGAGMGKVERIISTNPYHYLRPEWQPGSLVRLADFDAVSE